MIGNPAMTAIPTKPPIPFAYESGGAAIRPGRARIRLDFLDGIRGLASLDIVFCHAGIQINANGVFWILPTLVNLTFSTLPSRRSSFCRDIA